MTKNKRGTLNPKLVFGDFQEQSVVSQTSQVQHATSFLSNSNFSNTYVLRAPRTRAAAPRSCKHARLPFAPGLGLLACSIP